MDFKIDFNIDFSDNEFEKYLANPTKYVEDAKARMREEAYERARAELEATRQKAVAFAKLQSELKAYQQELQVEVNQYMKTETQKLIASVQGSATPSAESQLPSPPQIESPKIANPQPSNPKATQQKVSSQKPQEDKSKQDNTTNKERTKTKSKPTVAERIQAFNEKVKQDKEEMRKEVERYARNIMWDALFSRTNNEYTSDNVYLMLQDVSQVGDDKALGDAIRDAIDNKIDYDSLVALTHEVMEKKLEDAYDYQMIQNYLDRVYNDYTEPGAAKQTSLNHPADENEPTTQDEQDALEEFRNMPGGKF